MAPTPTILTADSSTTDGTSFVTASISPTGDRLLVLSLAIAHDTDLDPTVTGNGLTWTKVVGPIPVAATRQLYVFEATGPSPSAGPVTMDFGATTQLGCAWAITQWAATNNPAVIVDTNIASASGAPAQLAEAIFPNAFGSVDAVAYGVFWKADQAPVTFDAAFTPLSEVGFGTPQTGLADEWLDGEDDPSFTWGSNRSWGCIGLEIDEGAGGGEPEPTFSGWGVPI